MAEVKLIPKITQAGLKALFDAENNQIKVKIAYIGFGDRAYKPTGFETELQNEKVRVPVLSGKIYPDLAMIDFSIIIPKDTPNFWIREIGFYDENGTLIFIWSDTDIIIGQKTQFITLLNGLRIYITEADVNLIQVVEAEPDVKLLYFEEWLSTSNAVIDLASSILRINSQLFEAQKQLEEHNIKIENINSRLQKIESDYYTFKPDVKSLLLALSLENVILTKKLIDLELQLKNL